MTDTEASTSSPTNTRGACGAPTGRRRLRRSAFAAVLLLSGVAIGAGSSAVAQGYMSHHGGPQGWMVHGRGHGHSDRIDGPMFGPGSVERMVERLARATDASSDQKQKINTIAQNAAADVLALREKHLAGRQQMREILAAPTIDRAKMETVRAEQLKLADLASKRITAAMADAAEVLTPAQRADLGKRIEQPLGGKAG